jgi:predicted ATPase
VPQGSQNQGKQPRTNLRYAVLAVIVQPTTLALRAALSLSRLWQHQGKRAEARQLLTEVYGCFTEGFDTADLQEAKKLLEILSTRMKKSV